MTIQRITDNVENLRIYEILYDLDQMPTIEHFDFTTIGLTKESPLYEKGRKIEASYTNDKNELVVKKVFYDNLDNNGVIKELGMRVAWYTKDGKEGLVKDQVIKKFNSAESKTLYRRRRQRAIDYLEASAEEKGVGWIIDLILESFKHELELFILSGNKLFENTLIKEASNSDSKKITTPDGHIVTLAYILKQKLPATEKYPEGQTVLEGIIEEII